MNTKQFLVLGLILIVIMLLFRNNRRESFDGEEKKMYSQPQINFADIINELETVLCLMETCPHCQKFKNMTEEQIKDELDIPKYLKLTKVVHKGPQDMDSQAVFEKFDVSAAPTLVLAHKGTGLNAKTYPSREMIADKVKELLPMVAQWWHGQTI